MQKPIPMNKLIDMIVRLHDFNEVFDDAEGIIRAVLNDLELLGVLNMEAITDSKGTIKIL